MFRKCLVSLMHVFRRPKITQPTRDELISDFDGWDDYLTYG